LLCAISFLLGLVIAFKYNSVKVFNKKIRTQNISNTFWVLFFFSLGFKAACTAVRYSLVPQRSARETTEVSAFFLAEFIMHGLSAFALSLALNHQRRFRSSAPPPQSAEPKETDPLLAKYTWLKTTVSGSEAFFFVLLLNYIVFFYLHILFLDSSNDQTFEILFYCAFGIQKIPVIVLMLFIVFGSQTGKGTEGPTRRSRVYLALGAFFNVFGDLPLNLWTYMLNLDSCAFIVGSWIDFIVIVYIFSLLFFFIFLRSEYLRNMEECIWTTVSQIQDTFDFRSF